MQVKNCPCNVKSNMAISVLFKTATKILKDFAGPAE